MRYLAPDRGAVDSAVWTHPALAELVSEWPALAGATWPAVAALTFDPGIIHRDTGRAIRFVEQSPALLADGRHYEQRIFECGEVATRADSWHDLFNALIWRRFPELKSAVNSRYAREFQSGRFTERNRAQMALTHFDEAGVVVLLNDADLLDAWNRHDWTTLFWSHREAWRERIRVLVFGHALLEHLLAPHQLLVGKALVVFGTLDAQMARERVADAILRGETLNDPQNLRPLPLSGIPGWFAGQNEAFYQDAPCFRPLRPGRVYPTPMWLNFARLAI